LHVHLSRGPVLSSKEEWDAESLFNNIMRMIFYSAYFLPHFSKASSVAPLGLAMLED
jgi:hypothetical protein